MFQAVYRWLNALKSGVGGDKNADKRKKIVDFMKEAKMATTKPEFERIWNKGIQAVPKKAAKYLTDTWKARADMW